VDVRLYEIVGVKAVNVKSPKAAGFITLPPLDNSMTDCDTASVASLFSTASARQRRDDALPLKRTQHLLDLAQRHHAVPLSVEQYCDSFNFAVHLFECFQVGNAISRLCDATAECPEELRNEYLGADLPSRDIRDRCDEAVKNPSSRSSEVLTLLSKG
jgi:hypothetical protein